MRARNIKPSFFKNEDLARITYQARILFIGLWCLADREGRLEDRPDRIGIEIFPYDRDIEIDPMLNEIEEHGFIQRYVLGNSYIQVNNFVKHQQPHYKETPSIIPPPKGHKDSLYIGGTIPQDVRRQLFTTQPNECRFCASKRDLTIDHIKPQFLGGTHAIENLQILCRKCNSAKNNRTHLPKLGPRLDQLRTNQSASIPSDSLIPDVLNPSSLNPEVSPISPLGKGTLSKLAEWFEKTWQAYPKESRKGRKAAWRHYQRDVKTLEDAKAIARALERYLQSKTVKDGFIQNASTWFNNWEDFKDDTGNRTGFRNEASNSGAETKSVGSRELIASHTVLTGLTNRDSVADRSHENDA